MPQHAWPSRSAPLTLLLASLALVGDAQQLPAPTYQTGVSLVIVDVTVLSRGGQPLSDLGAADFTLTVDGRPRRIVSHRLVGAGSPSEPTPAPPSAPPAVSPSAPPRRIVMVLDRDHMPAGEGQQMLAAAAAFVDTLPSTDFVATWRLDAPATTLRFGNDREAAKLAIRQAVGTFRPPLVRFNIARDEAIPIEEGNREMLSAVVTRECYKMPQSCPEEVEAEALVIARDARDRADRSLAGLEALVKALGSLDGPKHVVLITGGPVSTRDAISTLARITAQAASSRVTIHALQVADTMLGTDSLRPQPLRIDQTKSAAYSLASATGGLATTPVSGEIGFGQLQQQLSATYELAFEPEPGDRDGKEHRIDVRVADRGFGVSVRARRTFRIDPSIVLPAATPASPPAPEPTDRGRPHADEPGAPEPDPATVEGAADVPSLTNGLARYATRFEQEFSAVVTEERYVQVVHPWRGNPSGPDGEPSLAWQDEANASAASKGGPVISRRQLLSDVLLVQLAEGQWLAYRDVAVVDGRPVRDRTDRVRDLFLGASASKDVQLRAIADESARYNLGDVRRNMNVPTLTLGLMRPGDQWRFSFRRQKDDRIDGRPARVLSFKESARPTLIGTRTRRDIPIDGRIWIDAAGGAVLRTELRFETGGQRRNYVRTDFGRVPDLDMLVPVRMWEWYEGADQIGRIGGDKTVVQCLATYGHFRRFQVTTSEDIK